MTKHDFEFDEQAALRADPVMSCDYANYQTGFVGGALYQYNIDLVKHNEIVGPLKQFNKDTLEIKIKLASKNIELQSEIATLTEKLDKAVSALNTIAFEGSSREYCTKLSEQALKEFEK
jgi:hypothetical protein